MISVDLEGNLTAPEQRCVCCISNLPSELLLMIRLDSQRCFQHGYVEALCLQMLYRIPEARAKICVLGGIKASMVYAGLVSLWVDQRVGE